MARLGCEQSDGGERGQNLLHRHLGAERRIGDIRVARERPIERDEADGDAVEDQRQRGGEQGQTPRGDEAADDRPTDKGDEAAQRESGRIEIAPRDVRREGGRVARPGIKMAAGGEDRQEKQRQERGAQRARAQRRLAGVAPAAARQRMDEGERDRADRRAAPGDEGDPPALCGRLGRKEGAEGERRRGGDATPAVA